MHIAEQYGRLISVSAPCEGVSFAHFLRLHRGQARFYWQTSEAQGGHAFAGVGTALELTAWGHERFKRIEAQARDLFSGALIEGRTTPKLFGGFAFRDDFLPDNTWADFTPAHFVLPHYTLTRTDEGTHWLALNVQIPPEDNPHALIPDLREALNDKIASLQETSEANEALPEPLDVQYPLDYPAWAQMIEQATQHIQRGKLKKVVLSRMAEIRFADVVDVDAALAYLNQAYPTTIRFLFEPSPHRAFFGATPEMLVDKRGLRLRTMALAGSRRRGATPEQDAQEAQALLADPKESEEHRLVVEAIRHKLMPLSAHLQIAPTQVYPLPNIQHLYTPIVAHLASEHSALSLLEQLHPTPALGGEPREAAMALIKDIEPAPRGWFAGPVGWLDAAQDGEFAVAIRSAVAQDRRVWLYAGVGVVSASEPQREWDETALKFRPMLEALGVRGKVQV
jgi:menaquinone-specific isochorismate synthase